MGNHYNEKLSITLGYSQNDYTINDLYDACQYYFLQSSLLVDQIKRNEDGSIANYDIKEIGVRAGASYQKLVNINEVFVGSSQPVKYLSLTSKAYIYSDITGIFMPFSGEPSASTYVYDITMPFTMAHEAAHRLAIADEQDCNFASFLACINNDDIFFQYSGYYCAFRYCFNSLYRGDSQLALELIEKYHNSSSCIKVINDYNNQNIYYQQFDSYMNDVGETINDTYLKLFSQEEGTLSYGMVSDDLVHYYLQKVK